MRLYLTLTVVLLLAVSAFAQNPGEMLFSTHCSNCHGADLAGKTPMGKKYNIPDLRSPAVQNLSDKEIYEGIARGVGHKEYPHAFVARGMTPLQINNIVAYIRSMKK